VKVLVNCEASLLGGFKFSPTEMSVIFFRLTNEQNTAIFIAHKPLKDVC